MVKFSAQIAMLAAAMVLAACNFSVPTPALTEIIQVALPTSISTELVLIEGDAPSATAYPVAIATYLRKASPTPTKADPTFTPTRAYPTATPTPVVIPDVPCHSIYPTRLFLGAFAVVSQVPALPNRLRIEPSTQGGSSTVTGWIQPGEEVVLLKGPMCNEGWVWWKVSSLASGLSGWTSEGDGANYWLDPLYPVLADSSALQYTVTITRDQIDGANDIEAAIQRATAEGSRPGTVVLDGSRGAFVFTDDDRSVNIFVSNLVLRGVNNAVIRNCGDGLYFDNFPLKNILVAGIEFNCEGEGVAGSGAFENVVFYQNTFRGERNGIAIGGASRDWLITENVLEGGQGGMIASGAQNFLVLDNQVSGITGITLRECSRFLIQQNTIAASYQGIQLAQESWQNMVQRNTVQGVSHSGITLDAGVTNNQILENRVSCATGISCLAVAAAPEVAQNNTIDLLLQESVAYSNQFELAVGKEWSHSHIETAPSDQRFLGQFGNDEVILNLTNLAEHVEVRIVLEVYLIRSWDGNMGPDLFQIKLDGSTLLVTTFDTQDFFPDHAQAYPDTYGKGTHPPRTGAKANNTLGYNFDGKPMDMIYQLSFTVPHTSSRLKLSLSAENLSYDLLDESWGIDNITVYTIK
jgi:hypothetical protein